MNNVRNHGENGKVVFDGPALPEGPEVIVSGTHASQMVPRFSETATSVGFETLAGVMQRQKPLRVWTFAAPALHPLVSPHAICVPTQSPYLTR